MKFLRNLLASILGTGFVLIVMFFLFLGVVSLIGKAEEVVVEPQTVLELRLDRVLKDYAPRSDDPIDELLGVNDEKLGLNELLNAIENAKTDTNIEGISIHVNSTTAGIGQIQSVRNKLKEFRETGKFVMAYADIYDQKAYYLGSVADKMYLNPLGAIDFSGLRSEVLFFKDLQDKTGVKMEVIRHGKYKAAVEPFLSDEMSAENREQISSFLGSIWEELLNDISESRNITVDDLNKIADELNGRNATLALENGLVDDVVYYDEYEAILEEKGNLFNDEQYNKLSFPKYIASGKGRINTTSSNQIAVIFAQGDIIYGKGDENSIGQKLIINAIRKARLSSRTKAIVLRINSSGGSALTSELIWREMELAKGELPVVVSLGSVAASGGYYLACNADYIYAEPTTITGSIGVFGAVPNMSVLAENIGINAEQVSTNKGAHYSVFEPMSEDFRAFAKQGVEQVYTTFLERVSEGRNMTVEEVDKVAQGRVWSGAEALELGLIDHLGGLDQAVLKASELAEVSDFRIRNYPNYKVDLEDRFDTFPFVKSKEKVIAEEIGEANYQIYKSLSQFSKMKGVQARMPFVLKLN